MYSCMSYICIQYVTLTVSVWVYLWVLCPVPLICVSVFVQVSYCLAEKAVAPTPALLPGKSHGRRSLEGCSPWGREESDTTERLHFHFSLSRIGEEMATHSSALAWRIPGTGEPGGLPSMGSHRVGHDWSDLAASAPLWWKWHLFFLVLVLEGLIGHHRTIQLQLLQHYWLGHRLGSPWYWFIAPVFLITGF